MKTIIIRIYTLFTLLLVKAHHGEKRTYTVQQAQRGVTAKEPTSFHHLHIPLRFSQPITGNPSIRNRNHICILSKHTTASLLRE